jgi:uncharacterized protein involved in propanediol utilization
MEVAALSIIEKRNGSDISAENKFGHTGEILNSKFATTASSISTPIHTYTEAHCQSSVSQVQTTHIKFEYTQPNLHCHICRCYHSTERR